MRPATCLDYDRELQQPAPLGAVRMESTERRLERLLNQAAALPADDSRAAPLKKYFDNTIQGRRY